MMPCCASACAPLPVDVTPEMQGWLAKAGWRWSQPEGVLQGQVRASLHDLWGRGAMLCTPSPACLPGPRDQTPPPIPMRPTHAVLQGPAATWAEREAAGCALLHYQLGFPLDLYTPLEYLPVRNWS